MSKFRQVLINFEYTEIAIVVSISKMALHAVMKGDHHIIVFQNPDELRHAYNFSVFYLLPLRRQLLGEVKNAIFQFLANKIVKQNHIIILFQLLMQCHY